MQKLTARPFILLFFAVSLLIISTTNLKASEIQNLVDMTYPFSEESIYWPTDKPFTPKVVFRGKTDAGYWYASNEYAASEHGGTHVDAPIHFYEHGRSIGQVPLHEWIGPAVKIDVSAKCAEDRNYQLSVKDILQWEKEFGSIPEGAWIIMQSGIDGKFYPDRKGVLRTDKTGKAAVAELSFPGFSPESVSFLVKQRKIHGIAIDTPSIDPGTSKDFLAHRTLCAAQKLALENIANLEKIPASGAMLYVIPMLIKNGTGAPARVFAVINQNK